MNIDAFTQIVESVEKGEIEVTKEMYLEHVENLLSFIRQLNNKNIQYAQVIADVVISQKN